jgi:hypothetical protein
MILKIKAKEVDTQAKEAWRLFDGIEDLHYSVYDEPVKQTAVEVGVMELDFITMKPASGVLLFCLFTIGSRTVHIWCNTEAYLLNDNGKTIERLI